MSRTLLKKAWLILLFLGFRTGFSTHVAGSEITYKYIGSNKYALTIVLYRDCRGITFPSTDFNYYYRFTSKSGTYTQYKVTKLKFKRIDDVTEVCNWVKPPCGTANKSSSGFGLERHEYADTMSLIDSTVKAQIAAGKCLFQPIVEVKYTRPGSTNSNYMIFYSEISLCNLSHKLIAYNNSGDYISIPNYKLTQNTGNYLTNALKDDENDSVKYKWAVPYESTIGTAMTFTSPYSYLYPLPVYCVPSSTYKCTPQPLVYPPKGLFLDSGTGDLILTPVLTNDLYTSVVEARQYRKDSLGKWTYLGMTRRDFSYSPVTNGYNFPPIISAKLGYRICANRTLNFDFTLEDSTWAGYQSAPDTLSVKYSGVPVGATLKETIRAVNKRSYSFSWSPKLADVNPMTYKIRFEVNDNHCSPPLKIFRTISILVDGGCCDTFKIPKLKTGPVFSRKVNDTISIALDTIKGYKSVQAQWQGKSPQTNWSNLLEGRPYSGTKKFKMKIDSVHFYHHQMQYRVYAQTDICRDSSMIATLKIADTCFFKRYDTTHIKINDTIRHHIYDTTRIKIRDTLRIKIYDTTRILIKDTFKVKVTVRDTIRTFIKDTIKVFDHVKVIDTQWVQKITYTTVQDTLKFTIKDTIGPKPVVSDLLIYPVPSSKSVLIKFGNYLSFSGYTIKAYDNLGQLVGLKTVTGPEVIFDMEVWGSKGIYHLIFYDLQDKPVVKKVVIYQ